MKSNGFVCFWTISSFLNTICTWWIRTLFLLSYLLFQLAPSEWAVAGYNYWFCSVCCVLLVSFLVTIMYEKKNNVRVQKIRLKTSFTFSYCRMFILNRWYAHYVITNFTIYFIITTRLDKKLQWLWSSLCIYSYYREK